MNIRLSPLFKTIRIYLLLGVLLLTLPGCTAKPDNPGISVEDAWARPALSGNNSAVYFLISNKTNENDRLLSASSTVAEFTEVHLSLMQDGKMIMQQQESVEIPANSSVEFKPKDFHIMLINLHNELLIGNQFELILQFEKAGAITITIPVQEQE